MTNSLVCFLIDDDDDDREIFCEAMEAVNARCKCVTAGNGQVALEMLNTGKVSPDIVFLDLNMPLMGGRQFLEEVNKLKILEDVPIVVLTTSADVNTKAVILESGAKEFITKPDKFSEWKKVLNQVKETLL